jgi:hypothetical protein
MSVSDLLQQATPAAAAIDLESQTAELLAAFGRIPSQEVRAAILTLVAGLAQR